MAERDALIDALVADLQPVQPIRRLRSIAALALAAALLAGGLDLWLWQPRPDLAALLRSSPGFLAVLVGLVTLGLGAAIAGLADAVPGRETLALAGASLGAVGGLVAAGVGAAFLLADSRFLGEPVPIAADLGCVLHACVLALPMGAVGVAYAGFAWPVRPARLALALGTGAVALGAVSVHLTCPASVARHVIGGHAVGPLFGGLLLLLPLRALVRRRRGRRTRQSTSR